MYINDLELTPSIIMYVSRIILRQYDPLFFEVFCLRKGLTCGQHLYSLFGQ